MGGRASSHPAAGDAVRAEVAEAALARAAQLGASYADIRINRYRRESIATREQQVQNVSRSMSYGFGLRVLVNGAWGFAASNVVDAASARTAAEQAVAIAKANAMLATRKVVLADADKVVTTWTSTFKKDPFEVPLETKIAFLLNLNKTAQVPGVAFVTSQVLFADEQKFFASSEGSRITQRLIRTYPQFQTTATDRASGDFQTRAVVDRAKLLGYEYLEEPMWTRRCRIGRATKSSRNSSRSRSRPAATTSSSIRRSCSSRSTNPCGHSTELDRALGYEANSAGTSFIKPTDAGKLRFGANIVNLVGDRTQLGGLATTGYDDEGVKSEQWHIVRDGMFVDWQTTRELAPLVGQSKSHGCLHCDSWSSVPFPRMPNVSLQPATTEVTLDDLVRRHQARTLRRGPRRIVDRSAALQLPVRRRRDSRNPRRQARRDGEGCGLPVTHAGLLGVVRRHRRSGNLSTLGHGGRRQGRTRPDQPGQSWLPARALPQHHRPQHGGRLTCSTRDDALKICETVLDHAKAAGADDAQVSLDNSVESHARFADNRITTSGRSDDVDITATVWVGAPARCRDRQRHQRRGPEAAGHRRRADCAAVAGAARVRADARPARTTPTAAASRRPPPTSTSPRAPRPCRRSSTRAARQKITGAGFHTARASASATATANGNRRYFRSTRADLSVTARTPDGTGSGYYSGDHFDLSRLDAQRIASEAVNKAVRSRNPQPIEPGNYPVILEPQAVSDLIGTLTGAFDARTAEEGRSAFSAKDGKTHLGEAMFSERLNLYSDPNHPSCRPRPATNEGVPATRLSLVKGGVIENLVLLAILGAGEEARRHGRPDELHPGEHAGARLDGRDDQGHEARAADLLASGTSAWSIRARWC